MQDLVEQAFVTCNTDGTDGLSLTEVKDCEVIQFIWKIWRHQKFIVLGDVHWEAETSRNAGCTRNPKPSTWDVYRGLYATFLGGYFLLIIFPRHKFKKISR